MNLALQLTLLVAIVSLVYYACRKDKKEEKKIETYQDPLLDKIYKDLKLIYPDLDQKKIKLYGANDTLTEDKKHMYLCIRKKNGEYYDYPSILYIAIHELAHVLNDEYDTESQHGDKFNNLNQVLLQKAQDLKLLPKNLKVNYDMCGTI
jgi:predicted metal-dependent hydrolase